MRSHRVSVNMTLDHRIRLDRYAAATGATASSALLVLADRALRQWEADQDAKTTEQAGR